MRPLVVAALLVVVAACSTPAPDTISISGTTASEAPTTRPAPSTTVSIDDAVASNPQAALELFAQALGTTAFDRIERVTGAPLTHVIETERIDERARAREVFHHVAATSADLFVASESDTRAVGRGRIVRTTKDGSDERRETFEGPFRLELAAGTWRVVDATYEGEAIASRIVRVDLEQHGLRLQLRLIVDAGKSTKAVFGLTDLVGGRRAVLGFVGASMTRGGATTNSGDAVFVTDRTGGEGYAVFDRTPGDITRLAVTINDGPQPLEFVFNL